MLAVNHAISRYLFSFVHCGDNVFSLPSGGEFEDEASPVFKEELKTEAFSMKCMILSTLYSMQFRIISIDFLSSFDLFALVVLITSFCA